MDGWMISFVEHCFCLFVCFVLFCFWSFVVDLWVARGLNDGRNERYEWDGYIQTLASPITLTQ